MINTQDIQQSDQKTAATEAPAGFMALVSDYIALTKPGIMALLLFTTLGAMLVAQAGAPPFWLIVVTLIGGWMTAGGANAFNCVIDRDIDAKMPRTRKRGTANGRISALQATIFASALTLGGFLLLGLLVNWVAAGIALAGNIYYVVIYTLILKRRTSQNIVIGGAAGAMPPLVGWAAVTGSISAPAWILFAIIFYWTPPHFWSLALLKQGEYGRVGMPMLPNVAGENETRRQILLYTVMLVAVSLLLLPFGMGWIYFIGAISLGLWFLKLALQLLMNPSKALARRTFFYSIWYLAGIFMIMSIDRLILG
jgi:protoheme IX farnesyltransferase